MKTSGASGAQQRENTYDGNGRLTHQKTLEPGKTWTEVDYHYDDVGNVVGYDTADAVALTLTTTANTLSLAQGYQLDSSISTTLTIAGPGTGNVSRGGLGYAYDANGQLWSTGDAGQVIVPGLRIHDYVSDGACPEFCVRGIA